MGAPHLPPWRREGGFRGRRCLPRGVAQEGFLFEGKAGETLDVKGYQAHAWVEVYRDGLGWLPVEVTGQSGLDSEALGAHDADPSPEPLPEGTESSPEPADGSQPSSPPLSVGLPIRSAERQNPIQADLF